MERFSSQSLGCGIENPNLIKKTHNSFLRLHMAVIHSAHDRPGGPRALAEVFLVPS